MGESTTAETGIAGGTITDKAIARAVGTELRLAREERGWTRIHLVTQLPSGIGDRTVLSYEHGTRHLTILRFIELCHTIGVSATELLSRAFQRARIHLQHLVLEVDLVALLADDAPGLVTLQQWANHKLLRQQSRIAEQTPGAVSELADVLGCSKHELTDYLAKFLPDERSPAEILTEGVIADLTVRAKGVIPDAGHPG